MHPLYIGSSILLALFIALIVWDTVVDLIWAVGDRRRAKRESKEESPAQPAPPRVRDVQVRGSVAGSLRERHHTEVKAQRRTFSSGQLNRSQGIRRPRIGR